jgi:hypothetical protein
MIRGGRGGWELSGRSARFAPTSLFKLMPGSRNSAIGSMTSSRAETRAHCFVELLPSRRQAWAVSEVIAGVRDEDAIEIGAERLQPWPNRLLGIILATKENGIGRAWIATAVRHWRAGAEPCTPVEGQKRLAQARIARKERPAAESQSTGPKPAHRLRLQFGGTSEAKHWRSLLRKMTMSTRFGTEEE